MDVTYRTMKFIYIFLITLFHSACSISSVNTSIKETLDDKFLNSLNGKWGGEVHFEIAFQPFEEFRLKCTDLNSKKRTSSGHRLKATFWVINRKAYGYILLAGQIVEIEEPLNAKGGFSFKDYRVYVLKQTEYGKEDFYLDVSGEIILNNEEKSSYGKITVSEFGRNGSCGGQWRLYQYWQ